MDYAVGQWAVEGGRECSAGKQCYTEERAIYLIPSFPALLL